jgi:hypothetical protein
MVLAIAVIAVMVTLLTLAGAFASGDCGEWGS